MKRPAAKSVFEQGLGLFGAPEDASLLDEVVAIAYEERRKRVNSERTPLVNTQSIGSKES
jgi:hypothetical protein